MAIIYVNSIDFDNCADIVNFKAFYKQSPYCNQFPQALVSFAFQAANHSFQQLLLNHCVDRDTSELWTGSNRQAYGNEFEGLLQNHNGFSYRVLESLAESLGLRFEPFLMADAENGHMDSPKAIEQMKSMSAMIVQQGPLLVHQIKMTPK